LKKNFKHEYTKASANATKRPKYAPPSPKLIQGVKTMIELMTREFATDKFVKSLTRSFVTVGLCRETRENYSGWVRFKEASYGLVKGENIDRKYAVESLEYTIAASMLEMSVRPRSEQEALLDDIECTEAGSDCESDNESDSESDCSDASEDVII